VNLVGAGVLLILLGGAVVLLLRRHARFSEWAFGLAVTAGCGVSGLAAVRALSGPPAAPWVLRPTLPGGVWVIALDGLSAWFLLLLAIAGGITTVFGVAYMRRERAHGPVAMVHFAWAILLAAMIGVLVAQSAVLFLLTWEVMAMSAYFLIMFEHDRDEVRRSGLVYLVLTHLGTLGLLVMFLAWGRSAPDLTFASLAAASRTPGWASAPILLLALFGFGIKAGLFPLHFWLPGAHAAAPSHVSALLSGVMLKIGIYGLFRTLALVGTPPAWWGWSLMGVGLASAVLGVLWALAQRDIKRCLAYSSVENVGIILMGLGLGSLCTSYRHPAAGLLGLAAALLHALNHALFKSLLFLGAGVVVRETGTRELDRLGGLARRMPRTAIAFVIGAIAIIGLPPLNGFVGEWTLVLGLLDAGRSAGPIRWTALGAAGIGVVGALALACFARLAGTLFLGRPRQPLPREIGDADSSLWIPMGLLAATCVSIGLAPGLFLGLAMRVASLVPGTADASPAIPLAMGSAASLGRFGALALLVIAGAWAVRAVLFGRGSRRSAATWGCAYSRPTDRMQYTASSFSTPILTSFSLPAGPGRIRLREDDRMNPSDRILRDFARPLWNGIQALALSVRPLQQGRITTYLQYMIWTVLLLLGFLFFFSMGSRP